MLSKKMKITYMYQQTLSLKSFAPMNVQAEEGWAVSHQQQKPKGCTARLAPSPTSQGFGSRCVISQHDFTSEYYGILQSIHKNTKLYVKTDWNTVWHVLDIYMLDIYFWKCGKKKILNLRPFLIITSQKQLSWQYDPRAPS